MEQGLDPEVRMVRKQSVGPIGVIISFLVDTRRTVVFCRSGRFFHVVLCLREKLASRYTFLATSCCRASAILSTVTHLSVEGKEVVAWLMLFMRWWNVCFGFFSGVEGDARDIGDLVLFI